MTKEEYLQRRLDLLEGYLNNMNVIFKMYLPSTTARFKADNYHEDWQFMVKQLDAVYEETNSYE